MDRSQVLVAGAVCVICGVTLLSGPAIGLVDLTQSRTAGLGEGNATVAAVDAPDTARFDRALESESYYLEVPDVRVRLASVTGQPSLSYKLRINEMGYTRSTTFFLTESDVGWVTLSLERDSLPGDRVTNSSYRGALSVVLRYNSTERVVYDQPVTVEVSG